MSSSGPVKLLSEHFINPPQASFLVFACEGHLGNAFTKRDKIFFGKIEVLCSKSVFLRKRTAKNTHIVRLFKSATVFLYFGARGTTHAKRHPRMIVFPPSKMVVTVRSFNHLTMYIAAQAELNTDFSLHDISLQLVMDIDDMTEPVRLPTQQHPQFLVRGRNRSFSEMKSNFQSSFPSLFECGC